MPNLTQYAQDKALVAMYGGSLTLALTRGGIEITDAGYDAQSITMSGPISMGDTGSRVVTNTGEVRHGPWAQDSLSPVEGWELRDTDGAVLAEGVYLRQERFLQGQEAVTRSRTLILGLR